MDEIFKLIGGFFIDLCLKEKSKNFYWGQSYNDLPIPSGILGVLVVLALGISTAYLLQ